MSDDPSFITREVYDETRYTPEVRRIMDENDRRRAADDLDTFFGGRKIGWTGIVRGRWQWRGSGYDEGWEDATDDELRELHRLLGEYLGAIDA